MDGVRAASGRSRDMKLYKYRSLRRDLDYVLDILLNERLYCAPYSALNDPLEGVFIVHVPRLANFLHPLSMLEKLPRVCSLSQPLGDIALWSHYADGHTGVAIELDLPIGRPLHEVRYVDEIPRHNTIEVPMEDILSVKTRQWEHEKEYRVIQSDDYFSVSGRITRVFVGARASDLHVSLLKRCVPASIPLVATDVSEMRAWVVPVDEIAR
jgi:hypothetical protein